MKPKSIDRILPVLDEPNHHELFSNQYIRVYIAVLKPGQETKYHCHTVDTIYYTAKGGRITTVCHNEDEGCNTTLIKKRSLMYKLKLLLDRFRNRPVYLDDGLSFFMPSSLKNVVHKAVASNTNQSDMVLIGIEFK